MLGSLVHAIKKNSVTRTIARVLLYPAHDLRLRWWVRKLFNLTHGYKGRNTIIRNNVRLDIFPGHGFSVGSFSIVEDFSVINNKLGGVAIGEHTLIGVSNTLIGPISIGDHVMLAQNVVLSGLDHAYEDITTPPRYQLMMPSLITVEDRVWIGANVVIVAGVHIGKHAVVGAGSVVTSDVPALTVVVGSPARIIRRYNPRTGAWEKPASAAAGEER